MLKLWVYTWKCFIRLKLFGWRWRGRSMTSLCVSQSDVTLSTTNNPLKDWSFQYALLIKCNIIFFLPTEHAKPVLSGFVIADCSSDKQSLSWYVWRQKWRNWIESDAKQTYFSIDFNFLTPYIDHKHNFISKNVFFSFYSTKWD